jgi:hypothetical protein
MLRLKEHITGFIYDSTCGEIEKIFLTPINEDEAWDFLMDDDVLVTNENVNELFEITSPEQLDNNEEGLLVVMEWID